MKNQKILILDFGGQYNQLIARRVRESNVYCEVKPFGTSLEEIKAFDPIGITFTGGPNSVYEAGSPHVDTGVYSLGLPILGICYGCQPSHMSWAAESPPRRMIPRANTARRRPILIPHASFSRIFPPKA